MQFTISKPMLAATLEDITTLKYPVLATFKLDGIRTICMPGVGAVSRTLKNIPNRYIFKELTDLVNSQNSGIFDGEILAGSTFQDVSHNVMSFEGEPDFKYYIFDYVSNGMTESYEDRMKKLEALTITDPRVVKLLPTVIHNEAELVAFEEKALADGFEGVILRSPSSPYKCGRSTLREGYLLKLKRFSDSEAEIIGFEELLTNTNVKVKNRLGESERSTHQENLIPANTLGAILVRDLVSKVEFSIGSGFDQKTRKEIWESRESTLGKIVKYKYFAQGVKDKPRFPILLGFRHQDDM